MTHDEWLAKATHLIAESEGLRLWMYHDSKGIKTIGIGLNLERSDAAQFLRRFGVIDPAAVIAGSKPITLDQANAIFKSILPGYLAAARASLPTGIFDRLGPARQFVILDLTYNMGAGSDGWGGFRGTQSLITAAVQSTDMTHAHALYMAAANHLASSQWAKDVGVRATRDIAMMQNDVFPDGSS